MQNKFLRIILNKPRYTRIETLHSMAKIKTVRQYIKDSIALTYNHHHENPLVAATGNYNIEEIPLKIRIKLPFIVSRA